jgi:hypothetical protein
MVRRCAPAELSDGPVLESTLSGQRLERIAMILYRPVGLEELQLICESGRRGFPPRLPEQPIFYPVLTLAYAKKIAFEWNTTSGTYAGYVVQFSVDDAYGKGFPVHNAGGGEHQELWVPAEQLDEFNRHIQGGIRLVAAQFGERFSGLVPGDFGLKGQDATAQLVALWGLHASNLAAFRRAIVCNHTVMLLHFPFWSQGDFSRVGVSDEARERLLRAIEGIWQETFPKCPLGFPALARRGPTYHPASPFALLRYVSVPPRVNSGVRWCFRARSARRRSWRPPPRTRR